MKLLRRILSNNIGVTLIELITVISLLLVVFSLGYGIFSNGTNTFMLTEKKLILQQNSRQIANIITNELRFANSFQLLQSYPNSTELQSDNYIVFNTDEKKIKHYINGILKFATEGIISDITFSTTFQSGYKKTLLNFSINSSASYLSQTLSYPLESNIILLNIGQNFSPNSSTVGVKYTKP
jgi:Tfp pilus assembly protein PilW